MDISSSDSHDPPDPKNNMITRHQSDNVPTNAKAADQEHEKAKSVSHLPLSSDKRKISIVDSNEGVPRRSMQLSRKAEVRQSTEFDRRTDGPFGRPSITMVRRASQQTLVNQAQDAAVPDLPPPIELGPTASQVSTPYQPEPPPLDYDLWSRKWWILGFWSLVIFDSVVCPVGLYFGLWYGLTREQMNANTVFSIVTAAVGGVSIFEYFLRSWKLVKKTSTCRIIDAKWWYLDLFHWNFTLGWILIMVELIVGTVQEYPPPRLIAMCVPTMLYVFAIELLILDVLRYFQHPAPIRMSSMPKGAQVRPGIYSIIEDVVAVDGSGGTAYRIALNRRYEASHVFRAMLRRLGLFWSIGSITMAVVCTILIFTIPTDPAYAIGWAAPFAWAGIWALVTIWYVKKKLREEKVAWAAEIAEKVSEP